MIFLLKPGETTIGESGVPIAHAYDDIVTEQELGRYDLSFKVPIEEFVKLPFEPFSVFAAHTPNGLQGFILQSVTKQNDHAEIYATHTFFRIRAYNVSQLQVQSSTIQRTLDEFRKTLNAGNNPFTFNSDIVKTTRIKVENKNAMDVLADGPESILGVSGGSLLRDNFRVVINKRTGTDRDVIIAKRKNIKDVELKTEFSNITTRLKLKKLIDPKSLIPKENGQGYKNNPTVYPPSGSPRGSLNIAVYDSTIAQLIITETSAYDIYDENGYRIFYNVQTGTVDSKQKAEERHQKNIEDLAKEQERKPELAERREELRVRISEQTQTVNDAQSAYNYSSTEENLKKLRSAQKTLKNSEDSFDNNREAILKNDAKIIELQKAITNYKPVILGERHLTNALPPGKYTIVQTKTSPDHLTEKRPREITITNGQTTTARIQNTTKASGEDQRMYYFAVVNSTLIGEYPYPIEKTIEVKDDNINSNQELEEHGKKLFREDHIDLPEEQHKVITTADVLEANLKINDTCLILYSDYNIYKKVPVVGYQFRPMSKTYISVEVGKKGVTLKGEINHDLKKNIIDLEQFLYGEIRSSTDELGLAFNSVWDKMEREFIERFTDSDKAFIGKLEDLTADTKDRIHEAINTLLTKAELDILTTEQLIEAIQNELGDEKSAREAVQQDLNTFKTESQAEIDQAKADVQGVVATVQQTEDRINTKITSVETELGKTTAKVTSVEQLANKISLSVYDETGASKIEQMANQILMMVTSEDFSSYIQQTAEKFTIYAKLTDIEGLVKFTDLAGTGSTFINGGVIKSNTIKTDALMAEIIKAKHLVVDKMLIDKLVTGELMVDALLAKESFIEKLIAKEAFIKKLQSIEINADQITAGVIQSSMGNFRLYLQESNSTPVMKFSENVISLTSPEQLTSRYLIMTYDRSSGGVHWGSQNGGIWFGMHKNRPDMTTDYLWLLKIGYDETYNKYTAVRFRCLTQAVFELDAYMESNVTILKGLTVKGETTLDSELNVNGTTKFNRLVYIGDISRSVDLRLHGDLQFKGKWIYSIPQTKKISKPIKSGYCILTASDFGVSSINTLTITVEYRSTPIYASIQPTGSNYNVYVRTDTGELPPNQTLTFHCVYS